MTSLNSKPLPALPNLKFVAGEPVDLVAAPPSNTKRVLVLEFWATWCGPCREVSPVLSDLQKKWQDKNVWFVGITQEDENTVKQFLATHPVSYTIAVDPQLRAQNQLLAPSGARGIPHAFLVDSTNHIVWSGHPLDPGFEATLTALAQHASPRKELEPLPRVTDSYDELMKRSIGDLKNILKDRGIGFQDCFEKGDLARRIVERCAHTTYYKQQE
ncbi:hypothetical protein HDU85_005212 [Gaertneriomyces sp. JEL0708]|nr:hypothetical protein HDU85_005212 [Gaertneriomyces sp. JEL0708]